MKETLPIDTLLIFILNLVVFVFSFRGPQEILNSPFVVPKRLSNIILKFGFHPSSVLKKPYILLTHMFIHGDWVHILANMLLFIPVGIVLEEKTGSLNFLFLFMFSGLMAVTFNVIFQLATQIPAMSLIGASGALQGILIAGALIYPTKKIPLCSIPIIQFFTPIIYFFKPDAEGNLFLGMIFFTLFSLLMIFMGNRGLAEISHLGGTVGGFLYFWFIERDKDNA